jgi:hydroxymethylglutaryl-CoA reductase (NADPH)
MGGITTVMDDAMQRAPIFTFNNARNALAFGKGVGQHFFEIKQQAKTSTSVGKL